MKFRYVSQVRVKSQKYSELDICGRETCPVCIEHEPVVLAVSDLSESSPTEM